MKEESVEMMIEMFIFTSVDFGNIDIIQINNIPYFPATKCAEMLGYKNPEESIREHCIMEDPWCVKHSLWVQTGTKRDGTPATRETKINFINEGNLYRLIMRSKLPKAKEFERWIFDEVLPSLRKIGVVDDLNKVLSDFFDRFLEIKKKNIVAIEKRFQNFVKAKDFGDRLNNLVKK